MLCDATLIVGASLTFTVESFMQVVYANFPLTECGCCCINYSGTAIIILYFYSEYIMIIIKNNTLQIVSANKQQSPDLKMPVECYGHLFGNYNFYITNIL